MTTYITHNSPFIPSYTHVGACSDLARVLLAAFPTPSTDARWLISLVLESGYEFFDSDEPVPQVTEAHICAFTKLELSDYLMALASRIGGDPKNEMWTTAASDARMMCIRIVFRLTNDLLDDTASPI